MSRTVRVELYLEPLTEAALREQLPARNIHLSERYVTGKKMRGALLSAIRRELCPYGENRRCINCQDRATCDFTQSVIPGVVQVTGALPACDCDSPLELAHPPLTWAGCKVCTDGRPYDLTEEIIINGSTAGARFCDTHDEECFRRPYTRPVCISCKKPLTMPHKELRPGIQIDDRTGSTVTGVLFFNETCTFEGHLRTSVVIDEDLCQYLDRLVDENRMVMVGAGRGRGWGLMQLRKVGQPKGIDGLCDELVPLVECHLERFGGIIMIARSPVAEVRLGDSGWESVPYVERIDGLRLERTFGRATTVSGWALSTGLQRPMIRAAIPGSVFFYRPEESAGKPEPEKIARYEFTGIGEELLRNSQLNQVVLWRCNT